MPKLNDLKVKKRNSVLDWIIDLPSIISIPILFVFISIIVGIMFFFAYGRDVPIQVKYLGGFLVLGAFVATVFFTSFHDKNINLWGFLRLILCGFLAGLIPVIAHAAFDKIVIAVIVGGLVGYFGKYWIDYI